MKVLDRIEKDSESDAELSEQAFIAITALRKSLKNIHRISSAAKDRSRNMVAMKGKGAAVGAKVIEDHIESYWDLILSDVLGSNHLKNLL